VTGETNEVQASACPFCERIARSDYLAERGTCVAFADAHPLTNGHVLVVPRRHAPRLLQLTDEEATDLWDLALSLARGLKAGGREAEFNLGLNEGEAAGQTIGHVHLHLIPRRPGDVAEPRGGIRWIMPERARYWEDG
jgi:diadenosine tetraphosphate (Ap4A) HIT family hydrolase